MTTEPDPSGDGGPPESIGDFGSDRETRYGFVPEFVKKVAVAGLGALFMTEEGIRALASQLKLPKEVLGFILTQAEKSKDEIGRVLSEELRRFFQSETLRDEFLKLLAGTTLEIRAEVRLLPNAEKAPSSGRARVEITEVQQRRTRRQRKE